jgi:hypothetical protein
LPHSYFTDRSWIFATKKISTFCQLPAQGQEKKKSRNMPSHFSHFPSSLFPFYAKKALGSYPG